MAMTNTKKSRGSILDMVQDPTIAMVQNHGLPSNALSIVKDGVSHFAETSTVLLNVLVQVGNIHPFLQATVSVFKTAITLEITRRENDQKVQTLDCAMCDMMEALIRLKDVEDSNMRAVEQRLQSRMVKIQKSIKDWGRICDSYRKRHVCFRFFASQHWQFKFQTVMEEFTEHRTGIQFDLQIQAHVEISTIKTMLYEVRDNVKSLMDLVFEHLPTSEEREVRAFVSDKGGIETVLGDDKLLEETLTTIDSRDEKQQGKSTTARTSARSLRDEIMQGVDQIIPDNREFDLKFDAMKQQLEEVKETVKHESDRVIEKVLSGPHDRIIDRDIYHVWKDMGWKGSVKARHLVLALHDHFLEEDRKGSTQNQSSDAIRKKIAEDKWALKYISVYRVHALIEAIDNDVSGFVTIAEVNKFTSARPQSWSLPHWIAYWTIGFEMTNHWYFRRIRRLLAEIQVASSRILPTNRLVVSEFAHGVPMIFVADLLAGLRNVDLYDQVHWDHSILFARFKNYILMEEEKLERTLHNVNYFVDDVNTLVMVTGIDKRVEAYLLPLLYLILRRTLWIIHQAEFVVLNRQELQQVIHSLRVIRKTVWDRAQELKSLISLKTFNIRETLKDYFYGMFYFVREPTTVNGVWMRTATTDASFVDTSFDRYTARYSLSITQSKDLDYKEALARREISHRGTIWCDACSKRVEHTIRLVCISCTPDDISRMDFCAARETDRTYRNPSGVVHLPSHNVVQFRNILLATYLPSQLKSAQALVNRVQVNDEDLTMRSSMSSESPEVIPTICVVCERSVTRPVWYCLTCKEHHDSDTLVCWDCNRNIERDRPWLFESEAVTENATHNWAHTLVLLPKPPVTTKDIVSVEKQLTTLQTRLDEQIKLADARFEGFVAEMRSRMERLEGLLTHRLLETDIGSCSMVGPTDR